MRKNPKIPVIALVLCALVGMVALYFKGGQQVVDLTSAQAAEIELEPTQADSAGVDPNSRFLLKSSVSLDEEMVANNLSIEPQVNFHVEDGADEEFLIVPEDTLEANQVYKFSLSLSKEHSLKWAFQTKGQFKVTGTLPRDQSTGVPINTGIEVSFSHLNFADPTGYFEISPKVKGRFEIHKKTAVFIPESLQPSTVYTVRVKKGLKLPGSSQTLEEDFVFQFETQDPDQNKVDYSLDVFDRTLEFTTSSSPVIPLGFYHSRGRDELPDIGVKIFRYKNTQEYIGKLQEREKIPLWAYSSRRDYLEDTSQLEEISSFSTDLKRFNYDTFVEFPQPLPAGFYLAEISCKDIRRQVWFQVTDLAVYAVQGENQALVWVHDLVNGSIVPGAVITKYRAGVSAVTDENGLARLAGTAQIGDSSYFIVSNDKRESVVALMPEYYIYQGRSGMGYSSRDYWKYLYLDRGLYQPDDTICYWGLVKPREQENTLPERITVSITKWEGWQDSITLKSEQVTLDSFTFSGRIQLPNLVPGYYTMVVASQGETIVQQGFEVQRYEKPAYRLKAEPDRKAVLAGKTMKFTVSAVCFEDTPVPNVLLNYSLDQAGQITTDSKGQAELTFTPKYSRQFYSVSHRYLYLHTSMPECGEISGGTPVIVLNNDMEIETKGEIVSDTGEVEIQLKKLSVDKVNRGEKEAWEKDAFVSGPAAHRSVRVSVLRREWDKINDGEYYDFINKRVEQRFRYEERRVPVTEGQVTTDNNGKAVFKFGADPKASYFVELKSYDYKGDEVVREMYLSGNSFFRDEEYPWYYLSGDKAGAYDTAKYAPGERVKLRMKNNETFVPNREASFLFITGRKGILDSTVQDEGIFHTVFQTEHIPNFWVRGVYFDGRFYHETPDNLVAFDETKKALNVKITTDRSEYRPKDKVNVSVEVRDNQGRPIQSKVNLSLVDEALFALRDQQAELLQTLYGDYIDSGILISAATHEELGRPGLGGAEKGGEGGSERSDFKDTAFFTTITTGANGKGEVSLELPDNLTSWRLTYHAITQDLQATSDTVQVKVTLPFFVDVVLNEKYLAGDRPEVFIRSLGKSLTKGAKVKYNVVLTGGEEEYRKTVEGEAYQTVQVPLPVLETGSYRLSCTGRTADGLEDTITLPVEAVNTFMTQEKTDFHLLKPDTKIKGGEDSLTTLTFSHYEGTQYLHMLYSLAGIEGSRLEQKLAGSLAGEMIKEYFPDTDWINIKEAPDLLSYQTPEGGVSILPYAGPDLALSAKVAALCPEEFDRTSLTAYFYQILNDPKESGERGAISLLGLAALGEPVLGEISLAAGGENLGVNEKLYLMLAQLVLGNEQPAQKTFKELVQKYGEDIGNSLRINTGKDADDIVEATALAAWAAGILGLPEHNKLQQYVMENQGRDVLTYLEELAVLKESLPKLPKGEVSFSYNAGDRSETVSLKAGETYTLVCSPEQLSELKFTKINGKIGVAVRFRGGFEAPVEGSIDGVGLKRTYQVLGKETREFSTGDLVMVSINYKFGEKAPQGFYRITDYLPAGLKILQRPYQAGLDRQGLGRPVEVDGQKAVFLTTDKGAFHYYARVVSGGSFTGENAFIQHTASGKIYGITPRDTVVIK
ncbi:MAG: Ig-like domain-containing protein [Bacillota bacterium]